MTDWPSSLPQGLAAQDFKYSLPDNTIRTQMDQGPDKIRRRTTSTPGTLDGSMVMSSAQWEDLVAFFQTTVAETGQFTFPNPYDEGATDITVRFRSSPEAVFFAPGKWRVSLSFEVMP